MASSSTQRQTSGSMSPTRWVRLLDAPPCTDHYCHTALQCRCSTQTFRLALLYPPRLSLQATQDVVSRVPQTTEAEFQAAVSAAQDAFPAWRRTPVSVRQRVMHRLQHLIRENMVR